MNKSRASPVWRDHVTTDTVHCVEEALRERILLEYTKGELRSLGKFLKEKIVLCMDSVTLGSEAASTRKWNCQHPAVKLPALLLTLPALGCVDTLYICYGWGAWCSCRNSNSGSGGYPWLFHLLSFYWLILSTPNVMVCAWSYCSLLYCVWLMSCSFLRGGRYRGVHLGKKGGDGERLVVEGRGGEIIVRLW